MVQYIFTPWRDRRELLAVRRQFYPALDGETRAVTREEAQVVEAAQNAAVARVAVWMQRGHCPHMVESTALLMAAVLADVGAGTGTNASASRAGASASPTLSTPTAPHSPAVASSSAASASYAARATYAAAFSRFVTGLLDGHQDRARKLSMHGLAQTVGLPPGFVELRHQATHEALPALRRLRAAARQALAWIWGYYWVNMEAEEDIVEAAIAATTTTATTTTETTAQESSKDKDASLRTALLECVDSHASDATIPASLVERWGEAEVLAALAAIGAEEENGDVDDDDTHRHGRALRCIRLSRTLLQKEEDQNDQSVATTSMEPKTRTRTRAKAAASSQPASSQPTSLEAKATSAAGTSAAPTPWTMGNLNLDAMRAAMAQSRQALYRRGEGEKAAEGKGNEDAEAGAEEKDEQPGEVQDEESEQDGDNDVAMAEDAGGEQSTAAPEPELPSRHPRWTRYTGEWTPRPIGVV